MESGKPVGSASSSGSSLRPATLGIFFKSDDTVVIRTHKGLFGGTSTYEGWADQATYTLYYKIVDKLTNKIIDEGVLSTGNLTLSRINGKAWEYRAPYDDTPKNREKVSELLIDLDARGWQVTELAYTFRQSSPSITYTAGDLKYNDGDSGTGSWVVKPPHKIQGGVFGSDINPK